MISAYFFKEKITKALQISVIIYKCDILPVAKTFDRDYFINLASGYARYRNHVGVSTKE